MCERRERLHRTSSLLGLAIWAVLLLLAGIALPASAQNVPAATRNWIDADYNFASRMLATSRSGDVYVLGDTAVGDYLVLKKFSAAGNLLWETTYQPAMRLSGVWLTVDDMGNAIAIAAIVTMDDYTPSGWVTLKLAPDGALLWANSVPGSFAEPRRVAVDASGDIYVAGRMWLTNSSGSTSLDSVLVKYGPGGDQLWARSFDNGSAMTRDEPYAMAISPDGTRIGVAGISGSMFLALMYDATGNLLWSNTTLEAYAANDVTFGAGNASFFATATYHPATASPYRMAIASFDDAGKLSAIHSYAEGERALRVRIDSRGNVVATGIVTPGYSDWMTIKADASGNLLWSRRYDAGRNNSEVPNMLVIDASDAVYVTGTGGPNPSAGVISYLKGVVAKYSADGAPQWAVWDAYSNGKAMALGAGNTFATQGFGYLVTTGYTQTGFVDSPPAAPTQLAGSVGPYGSGYEAAFTFADNAANEFWVELERCAGAGCSNFATVAQTRGEDAQSVVDRTLARGVTYTYRVRAVGFMGSSAYSNTVTLFVPEASLPAAPSELTAAASAASVVLSWKDNSTNATQFAIERCQGTACSTYFVAASNGTSFADYAVAAGQTYAYRVRALNADGYSGYSNTATVTIPSETPVLSSAPSNLGGRALGPTQVSLAWSNGAGAQDAVKIERCKGQGCAGFAEVAVVAGNATTYVDSGLAAGTTYRYRVRSHGPTGDSAYSNTASVKTSRK